RINTIAACRCAAIFLFFALDKCCLKRSRGEALDLRLCSLPVIQASKACTTPFEGFTDNAVIVIANLLLILFAGVFIFGAILDSLVISLTVDLLFKFLR